MTQAPFGTRDDIRDHEIAQDRQRRAEREGQRLEREQREKLRAAQHAAEDGSPPLVLGRVFSRQGTGLVELVLVDHQPTPVRVLLCRGQNVDPINLIGTLRTIGATLNEHQGYHEPEGKLWSRGVIDPYGAGGAAIPENVPPVGAPLYSMPTIDVTHEPSDDEKVVAHELAVETVDALGPTKARARDLADALRTALASGPHAVLALADALEEHGRPAQAPTPADEPPRAA